jgi:alkanesulfonate monooxygenase SsuD/methylene tetrahydromethanopterin reductase-like flavin-dependent oxidoreductase (luciferase family)
VMPYAQILRLGVLILPEHRLPGLAEKWSRAEGLGFGHAWTYDHIAWRELRDSAWFAAVPTLAAAAMVTSTIRLGTLVASPSFRHPVPFARELLTLDHIAGGRLTVGIGAGAQGWDETVLGQKPWSMPERLDRFAEFVDLLDRLLTTRAVSFEGRFYSAREARTHPGCVQQPRVPFAIAATGPKSMRVAARHASIWVTNGDRRHEGPPLPPDQGATVVARQLRLFEQACEAEGRDPAAIDKLVLTGPRLDSGLESAATFRTVVDAYAAVGITDLVVPWPRHEAPYAGNESILDQIAALG